MRRIFILVGEGIGLHRIAHILNGDRVPAPRPSRSGPRGWQFGTIRAIVERPLYKGVQVWNRTAKRTLSGTKRSGIHKPPSEWITVPKPELRIVSDEVWQAAQDRWS